MNYYEHHLGDYAEATAHLSFVEDAAYSRLMRKCYATEKPLPADIKQVQRLVGARTKEEREAVIAVLDEFWELREDGYHNARCDAEIARFKDKQRKAKASAEARWSHTDRNANASQNAMRTHSEGNALQTPDTIPKEENPPASRVPPTASPRPARKCPPGFEVTLELVQWAQANAPGVDVQLETAKFLDHTFATARSDWTGTWRNWIRKAAETRGPPTGQRSSHPTATEQRVATLNALTGRNRSHAGPERSTGESVVIDGEFRTLP